MTFFWISTHSGEAETIILAKEIDADFVIIDENIGYKFANNAELTTIRTLSILLKAKEKNIISEIKPLLDEMILKGRWYSKNVYQGFLTRAGELWVISVKTYLHKTEAFRQGMRRNNEELSQETQTMLAALKKSRRRYAGM